MNNTIIYAYVKGDRYNDYLIVVMQDDEEINRIEFDEFNDFISYIINNSNYWSIKVQFYK